MKTKAFRFELTGYSDRVIAVLTNDHAQSRYGLLLWTGGFDREVLVCGPKDMIGTGDEFDRPASRLVQSWLSAEGRTEEEMEAGNLFLSQAA